MPETEQADLTTLTVQLLSAYVSNNSVPSTELAELIETTRAALAGKKEPEVAPPAEFVPAVTVRKSTASRDHLLSMIDGKPYKSLKRHLSSHGLTPVEYRERYRLPKDYPMVAPGYSEARRAVAQRLGLGRRPAAAPVEAEASPAPVEAAPAAPAKKRGPKPKVTSEPLKVEGIGNEPAVGAVESVAVQSPPSAAPRKPRSNATPAKAQAAVSVASDEQVAPTATKSAKAKAAKPATTKPKRAAKAPAPADPATSEKAPARRSRKLATAAEQAPASEAVS